MSIENKLAAYVASMVELNLELKEALNKIRDLQWEIEWKDKKIDELNEKVDHFESEDFRVSFNIDLSEKCQSAVNQSKLIYKSLVDILNDYLRMIKYGQSTPAKAMDYIDSWLHAHALERGFLW
jgi:peptidoglycan hydrolase CwlO-like protein